MLSFDGDNKQVCTTFLRSPKSENEFGKCVNSVIFILIERLFFFNHQHIVKALARKH